MSTSPACTWPIFWPSLTMERWVNSENTGLTSRLTNKHSRLTFSTMLPPSWRDILPICGLSHYFNLVSGIQIFICRDYLDQTAIGEIKQLMARYAPNQLRVPLHAAVMISPLYLLAPIQLFSMKWDRHAMLFVRPCIFTGWLPC